jgi:hypothetical protein
MIWLILQLMLSDSPADIPTPKPEYAEQDLGPPRLPPYSMPSWMIGIPIGLLGALGLAVFIAQNRRKPHLHIKD